MSTSKPSFTGSAAKTSKRKAAAVKKTAKVKTKMSKSEVATVDVADALAQERAQLEQKMTDRRQRVSDRAKARTIEAPVAVSTTVEAVKITDVSGVVYDKADYDAMVAMYDSTIKDIKEGEIVRGRVLGVTMNDVIVDVGFKSEGIIPIGEFTQPINIKVGEEIDVFLEQIEDSNGELILSKQKADFMRVWDKIREVHDSGQSIEGRVARRIKGGVVVDIMGVDAFLPGSQISLRQVPDFDALIGQMMAVKIIKLNKNRRNIVVSRRVVLEEERETMRSSL
ncbi:MAG: S1 RNA-binding domain-containing protein, partial [candidate division Zixibacteria bacterium]|nr:S1 RNA-binding domain-containing protein [candidate division Zixibacteria bacterium]